MKAKRKKQIEKKKRIIAYIIEQTLNWLTKRKKNCAYNKNLVSL